MRHRLFLARGFGMHIDDDGITYITKRRIGQFALDRRKGIVEGIHEYAPHDIDDKHLKSTCRSKHTCPATGRADRIVDRPNEFLLPLYEYQRFALVESVIAQRHTIRAGAEQLIANGFGNTKSARRILTVDDDEIQAPKVAKPRQLLVDYGASRAAKHVPNKEQ